MIDVGYKFKSLSGVNVTVIKQYNTWGSFIVEMRKLNDAGRVVREGVKLVNLDDIKSKAIDFEEDYIKKYTDIMKREVNNSSR